MPKLELYSVFISHAWSYDEDYERLVNLLENASRFEWRNYSVPHDDPVVDPDEKVTKRKLIIELEEQIRPADCILLICGMYVARKEWIQKEIELAQKYEKPIIAIVPRGNEKVPKVVQESAAEVVGWNTDSIVEAIRKHAI
jgi:hypothetical protein